MSISSYQVANIWAEIGKYHHLFFLLHVYNCCYHSLVLSTITVLFWETSNIVPIQVDKNAR